MFTRFIAKTKAFFSSVWHAIAPDPAVVRGAGRGVLAAALGLYAAFVVLVNAGPLKVTAPIILVMLALGGLLLLLGQGLAWALGVLAKIPWDYRWPVLAAAVLLSIAGMGIKNEGLLALFGFLTAAASLVGGGIAGLRRWSGLSPLRRGLAAGGLGLGAVLLLGGLGAALAWRGQPPAPLVDAAAQSGAPLVKIDLPDPGLPGPYPVKTLTYGSGSDRYRPEFGADAVLKTTPVDGSKLLDSSWKGFTGQLRTLVWGFGADRLPLNGRVWYPDGEGPFPLVVFVHGNHNMTDFSDPGYAYLGELLASRGIIFVSVDENFLNGGSTDLFENFSNENDARGWLLLQHLKLWTTWARFPQNQFYRLVDLDNLAVGGHSRGGEAAAVAAAFNRLPYYPDNSGQAFDFNYQIRAVVAIAPIDGQYYPAQRSTRLRDVDYLVLHGSHDSDVTSFDGIDQYERVDFSPGWEGFKAAVYIYRANHGQFNTTWGDSDLGGLVTGLLNRGALLDPRDQRQAAKVYISAFLAAALQGETGYLPLLQDSRSVPAGWLPRTVILNRFEQAGDLLVAGFDEDVDLTTASLEGGSISASGLDTWREQRLHGKWGERESSAVYLGWNEDAPAAYTVSLPAGELPMAEPVSLVFHLGDANQDPDPAAEPAPGEGKGKPPPAPRQPVDLTVALEDASGQSARVRLSAYRLVQPQLAAELYKLKLFERHAPSEPFLQSYVLPLADFVKDNPAIDPRRLKEIRFEFDRTKRGSLILDGLGLRGEE